jgi:hypothetical protein
MQAFFQCSETFQQDILSQVFHYLDLDKDIKTLLSLGQTCKIFRTLCSAQRETHLRRVIAVKKASMIKERQIARYNFFDKASALVGIGSAIVYPTTIIVSFLIGLIYLSILAPLTLDGAIDTTPNNLWLISTPLWFLFVLPILLFIFHFILVEILRQIAPRCTAVDETSIFFEHDILNMFPISMGTVIWIPMIFLCSNLRMLIGITPQSFRVSFIPLHIIAFLYVIVPIPVMLYYGRKKRRRQFTSFVVYCASSFINIFVSLQTGLISGKLDQAIDTYWMVILIPTIVLLLILMSSLFIYLAILAPIMSCKYRWHEHWYSTPHFLIGTAVAVLPFLFSIILFSLRLDLFITIPYIYCFIPLYVGPALIPVIGFIVLCLICLNIAARCDCEK